MAPRSVKSDSGAILLAFSASTGLTLLAAFLLKRQQRPIVEETAPDPMLGTLSLPDFGEPLTDSESAADEPDPELIPEELDPLPPILEAAQKRERSTPLLPQVLQDQGIDSATAQDIEAGARLIASENPRGSERLHIEQVYTQLRSRKKGQSLYKRITAGSGWGEQGKSVPPGKVRPVSTAREPNNAQRELVKAILAGKKTSQLDGARKFFEPAVQDRALAVAERARAKQARGETITDKERRLLGYKRDGKAIHEKWISEGSKYLDTIDGVEFFT